ncbi:MAG: SUF system Fe-S cluster assembly regulator [Myxococcota bacterium]|jgi:FeS assembly SUF system regulator|nr:SUF system Fe-S cluster assembly regulator [Myxococcota bacterium]
MIRLAKLTDYAIVIATQMAASPPGQQITARALAGQVGLALPTVSKILKTLARGGLLEAQRGKGGGYRLKRLPADISVAEIIEGMEGPLALTDCASDESTCCSIRETCSVKGNWQKINHVVHDALRQLSLESMMQPLREPPHIHKNTGAKSGEEDTLVTIGRQIHG